MDTVIKQSVHSRQRQSYGQREWVATTGRLWEKTGKSDEFEKGSAAPASAGAHAPHCGSRAGIEGKPEPFGPQDIVQLDVP